MSEITDAPQLLSELLEQDNVKAALIGEVIKESAEKIVVVS